ncbi:MAG TPA: M1 family metallopeptidase [Candidatus Angelobacter sp.]|nr:M1 family metallopeptidase [Candidatus Angelobacter sp.]
MSLLKKSAWITLLFLPLLAQAQRLPYGVTPQHYSLTFTPDLQKAVFAGEETIDVEINQATSAITLNAIELEFQEATVTQESNAQPAKWTFAPEKEQATLTVGNDLQPGPATIHIKFTGILNDKLRGFYLARTKERNYGVTQFESTDARRAFPSFDEPAMKAKFDITLIVDKADTAISNGRIISDTPGPGDGKHTLQFSTSAKMSTYLVAMAVGDFACSEATAEGVPIRVCGTPDKKPLGTAALRYAGEILKFYNQYYGIPYPFGKLDIVGAPDFEAGAMENTGAIFYRESDLFIDDQNSSVDSHQAVFEVLAHEMAHQWFGDLVTMKWWDNIWLNEGFATWMALKPSQALHPEWNAALDAVNETNTALTLDALVNTHPIRAKANTPEEINALFDQISYEKAGAVLRMVESYVSPEVFRRGVNVYLRRYTYGNASAEDFWNALMAASGRPVDKIMPTFVDQAGEPVITVKATCANPPAAPAPARRSKRSRRRETKPPPLTQVTVTQNRFWADPTAAATKDQLWMVPVCLKSGGAKPFCQILSQKTQTLPVAGCAPWVFINGNAAGYYRTQYDKADLQKLTAIATTELTTAERISLVRDQAALLGAGQATMSTFLDLVSALNQDGERSVVESYSTELDYINHYLLSGPEASRFRAWVRENYQPMMTRIGWAPAANENADTHTLRGDLIHILGMIGEDPETIKRATSAAQQYVKDPDSVDPSIAKDVLRVAARFGNEELFEQYLNGMRQVHAPEQFYNIGEALSEFRDPKIVQRILELGVSEQVRNQDAARLIARVLSNTDDQKVAWEWVKAHWADVEKKITMSSGPDIVGATRHFCSADMRDDVQTFFSEHKVPSAERTLKQAFEDTDACIKSRGRLQTELGSWVQEHSGASRSGSR